MMLDQLPHCVGVLVKFSDQVRLQIDVDKALGYENWPHHAILSDAQGLVLQRYKSGEYVEVLVKWSSVNPGATQYSAWYRITDLAVVEL